MPSFSEALHEEHADEALFLFNVRALHRSDPLLPWAEIESFEARLEAHVDALVLGGEPAKAAVIAHDDADSPAGAYVLARLAAEAKDLEALVELSGSAHLTAVAEGLAHAAPKKQRASLLRALEEAGAQAGLLYRLRGWWRAPWPQAPPEAPQALSSLAWALVRSPNRQARRSLRSALSAEDVPESVVQALLQIERQEQLLRARAETGEAWALLTLAWAGEPQDAQALAWALARPERVSPALVAAAGAHGHPSLQAPLLDLLAEEALGPHAAWALFMLTGTPVVEMVHPDGDEDLPPAPRLSLAAKDWQAQRARAPLGAAALSRKDVPHRARQVQLIRGLLEGRDPGFEAEDRVELQLKAFSEAP